MLNFKSMKIISKEFKHGEYIPEKFTCRGENVNPELEFLDVPSEAKSLVLIMDDPDVPPSLREDRNFDHWILFNIPPETRKVSEDSKIGTAGLNTRGGLDYVGPCPPDTVHRYFFRLYALDDILDLEEGASKEEVYKAMEMEGKILAKTHLVGLYEQDDGYKSVELR